MEQGPAIFQIKEEHGAENSISPNNILSIEQVTLDIGSILHVTQGWVHLRQELRRFLFCKKRATFLTKFWSKLVKIGRHWSKDVFGQGDLELE